MKAVIQLGRIGSGNVEQAFELVIQIGRSGGHLRHDQGRLAPAAFVVFLDRGNNNGGFIVNLCIDLFDATPEISVRERAAERIVKLLPSGCRLASPAYQPKSVQDSL